MRVLHCVHTFAPEARGGTQEYVAAVAQHQQRAGHEVTVLTGSHGFLPGGVIERQPVDGIPVLRLFRDQREALSGNAGCARMSATFGSVLDELAPDLVHVHHWETLTRDLVRQAAARGIDTIVTLHDLFASCARLFRMPDHRAMCSEDVDIATCARCIANDVPLPHAELENMLQVRQKAFAAELRAARCIVTVSDAQRALLERVLGDDLPAARTLPMGIAPPAEVPPPASPVPGRLRIANWGGLDPRKGLDVLVDALQGSAHRAAFTLHLHGRAGEESFMKALRRRAAGLDVRWHGPFADGEQWTFGARHDVAVFPFLAFETHGLVVDEALHAGLPVLVSDHGAPPFRLGGRGRAFARGDAAALRGELERLLHDEDARMRMRAADHGAITFAEHMTALTGVYANTLTDNQAVR